MKKRNWIIYLLFILLSISGFYEAKSYRLIYKTEQTGTTIRTYAEGVDHAEPALGDSRNDYAHWPSSPGYPYTVNVALSSANLQLSERSSFRNALAAAAGAWNGNSSFNLIQYNVATNVVSNTFSHDGQNVCYWITNADDPIYDETGMLDAFLADPSIIVSAVTMIEIDDDNIIWEFDIAVNGVTLDWSDQEDWDPVNGSTFDVQAMFTHELGHGLGLGHSDFVCEDCQYSAIPTMWTPDTYSDDRSGYIGSDARSLHDDDIGGMNFLYPQKVTVTSSAEFLSALSTAANFADAYYIIVVNAQAPL
ncbi:MAG: hypothetical protein EPO24_05860, partial [Bacteroidetes bacterium]